MRRRFEAKVLSTRYGERLLIVKGDTKLWLTMKEAEELVNTILASRPVRIRIRLPGVKEDGGEEEDIL